MYGSEVNGMVLSSWYGYYPNERRVTIKGGKVHEVQEVQGFMMKGETGRCKNYGT